MEQRDRERYLIRKDRQELFCIWQTLIRDGRNPEGMEGEPLNCIRCLHDETYKTCNYYTPIRYGVHIKKESKR